MNNGNPTDPNQNPGGAPSVDPNAGGMPQPGAPMGEPAPAVPQNQGMPAPEPTVPAGAPASEAPATPAPEVGGLGDAPQAPVEPTVGENPAPATGNTENPS